MHKTLDKKIIGRLIFSRKRKTYNSYTRIFLSVALLLTNNFSRVLGDDHFNRMPGVTVGVAR